MVQKQLFYFGNLRLMLLNERFAGQTHVLQHIIMTASELSVGIGPGPAIDTNGLTHLPPGGFVSRNALKKL